MGYFTNGTAGMDYEATYCDKCVHQEGGCAVWLAHGLFNYKECNNDTSILNILIPLDATDNITNERCAMFYEDTLTAADKKYLKWVRENKQ